VAGHDDETPVPEHYYRKTTEQPDRKRPENCKIYLSKFLPDFELLSQAIPNINP
jgi:hypothetical protein